MVRTQIERRGVRNPRVLQAMRTVPRECFVPPAWRARAFADEALPLGEGQTISQPYVVAHMIEALGLTGGERVLEVGTGSGYAAAVLAELAAEVVTVERVPALAEAARARLARLGYPGVLVVEGDGTLGCPDHAPYGAILVSAGAPRVPPALASQLAPGGRLVLPVGRDPREQTLERHTAPTGREGWRRETLGAVRFVPLIGRHGWPVHPPSRDWEG